MLEFILASYSRGIPSVIQVLEFERDASSIPSPACKCDVALKSVLCNIFKLMLACWLNISKHGTLHFGNKPTHHAVIT